MAEVMNMFVYATRNKVRFPYKGSITTEDLWDLSVTELDKIYKTLNAQVKQTQEESLLKNKSSEDAVIDYQINIIKYIVDTKLQEQEARDKAAEKAAQRQKIMAIIAKKQDESLENASLDDLQAMLDALNN